jgi:uncharacterized protein with HEPN domain
MEMLSAVPERDELPVSLMYEATGTVVEFTTGMSYDEFVKNRMAQSAVLMQITIIGELVKKISDETKSHIAMPWREIAGFRNRVVHDYFAVQLPIVWETAQKDIVELRAALAPFVLNIKTD